MWIKKNNTLINLEKFDAIKQDNNDPDLIVLVKDDRKLRIGYFEHVSKILEEIAETIGNCNSLYKMPCEKK